MQTFQQVNEASADNAAMLSKIYRCTHCGEEIGKLMRMYCNDCTYAKIRKEMCEENRKLNSNYRCISCGVI